MGAIEYREATKPDIAGMARLRALDWENEAFWTPRIEGYMKGTHHPQRALAPRVTYVAMDNGTLAGFIAGHLTQRFGCAGELQWITVAPECRRKGIASELIRLLAGWFVARKAARVCVNVSPGNADAHAFYRRRWAEFFNESWLVWEDIGIVLKD